MNFKAVTSLTIAAAVCYLLALNWAMNNLAWDIWGAMVMAPLISVATFFVLQRIFVGAQRVLFLPMLVGFAAKLVGSAVRYWVAFDAYGGSTDAQRYHSYGSSVAGRVWRGEDSPFSLLPHGTGTRFVERFTALVYALVGSSKLAGFVIFGWFAFWGMVLFVKAAFIAVPGIAWTRYAWLCALAPSLVYWPSSIGKEALMMLFLGLATYGIARLVARLGFWSPLVIAAIGLAGAASVRPHMAGIWLAAVLPALLVAVGRVLRRNDRRANRGAELFSLSVAAVIAAVALMIVGSIAMRYLKPGDEDTTVSQGITAILAETTRRSETGGSNFAPMIVSGPADWPYAVVRTLTRPLPLEARGVFQLLSAAEMAALIAVCVFSWRRLLAVPRSILTVPFVAFAMTSLFVAGLAYTSFANLGILTRQKSLVFPFLLLIPCLPLAAARRDEEVVDEEEFERHVALVR